MRLLGQDFPINPSDPDAGLGQFEHQAAGLVLHANDRFSENRYRGERARIGELNVGERTHGAESDDDMTRRDQYRTPRNADGTIAPRTTPATIPGQPAWRWPWASGGAGGAGRIGESTDHDHDHDHH